MVKKVIIVRNLALLCYIVIIQTGLLIPFNLIGQINKEVRIINNWYKQADILYNLNEPSSESDQKALELFLAVASNENFKDKDLKVHSLIKAGNIHLGNNRFSEANEIYHWALKMNNGSNTALSYEVFLYLGSSMYFNGVIDSAKQYFEQASEISVSSRHKMALPEQDRLYNSLGAIYYQSANYKQAQNYLQTALDFASPNSEDYYELYTSIQSNIASCLLKLNLIDSSIRILRKLNKISKGRDFILQNMAHAYFEKGQYDTALILYNSLPLVNGLFRVVALNDIGRIHLHKGNLKMARNTFDSALKVNRSITGNLKNKEEALTYFYIAQLEEKQGKTDIAIVWCNKAINELNLNAKSKNENDLPVQVSKTVSPIIFYQILNYKAELIFKKYQTEKKEEILTAALQTVVKAVECANFISKNLDNDDAKLFFIKNAQKYYEQGVKIAFEASARDEDYLQELIFILEGYKGNVLRQNLEVNNLKLNSGIPDSLTHMEKELKGLYAVYLSKLNQATNEKESGRMQKKLDSIQVSLSRLQKAYEKYEVFTWVKNSQTDHRITLAEIRKSLDGNTALVNYFVTGNEIYLLAISKNKLKAARVPIGTPFSASLKMYLQECFRIQEGIRYEGYSASHEMFRYLLEPVYNVVSSCSKLVIIPDKYLFQLPFDGLLASNGPRDYLVKSHSISFHYSFSLLLQAMSSPNLKTLSSQGMLAFAPFSEEIKNLGVSDNFFLPFSGAEINRSSGRKYFSSSATKQQFLKEYKYYGILHLATHASLGNDSSSNWIQFYPNQDSLVPGRLYVHEVYNLQLEKNGLVILSACESGTGLTVSGEGLLSLSRAFMYAGAGGIISTLYKTDDRVTAFLMKRLYYHMERGLDPAEALQKSKVDLLETNELNPRLKTPNYWSNFVYIGRITPNKSARYLWFLPVIIAAGMIVYLFVKRRKLKPE